MRAKLKTNKSASKRYKCINNSKFLYHHACLGHLLMKKSNKQKRKLMQLSVVTKSDRNNIKKLLPYWLH
jgi:large subunit ribosomal protein L35